MNVLFADNAIAIANRIDRLLTDMHLADTIAENSKKLSSIFSWEQIASDHIKAYERLQSC
jgi:predicted ATP-grasp superfamily ATP-dependent carboligase